MILLGMVFAFGAYSIGSYGYVLVRGWNITPREWFSPLHPYQWPANGQPDQIPVNSLFPVAGGGVAADGLPGGWTPGGKVGKKAQDVIGKGAQQLGA